MKSILTIFLASFTTILTAQVTFGPDVTGLPTEVHATSTHVVYSTCTRTGVEVVPSTTITTKNGVRTTTTKLVMRYAKPQLSAVNECALNLASIYVNNNGCKVVTSTDTSTVLTCPAHTFNGYSVGWMSAHISKSGAKRYFTVRTQLNELTMATSSGFKKYSRAVVDSLSRIYLKLTVEQLELKIGTTYTGAVYDANTYLTSYFPYFTVENGLIVNRSFVNGQLYTSINSGNLKYVNGNTWSGFNYSYLLYNSCGNTGSSDGFGNFGFCAQSTVFQKNDAGLNGVAIWPSLSPTYTASNNTFTYDASRPQQVIGLNMGNSNNANGLGGMRIYFDLSSGKYRYEP